MGSKSREYSSHAEVLKPLLNGCLTGQLHSMFYVCSKSIYDIAPSLVNNTPIPDLVKHISTQTPPLLKRELLCGSMLVTASLGTFEIFTNRLRQSNSGGPLTLYQECGCALMSGTITSFAWHPFRIPYAQLGLHNFTYTNLFTALARTVKNEGAMSLWRGWGPLSTYMVAAYAGILASHDRSLNYFTQTRALPEGIAEMSAGIISGFVGAACCHPLVCLREITKIARARNANVSIPRYIHVVLRDDYFYRSFLKRFGSLSLFSTVIYSIYGDVRKLEGSV